MFSQYSWPNIRNTIDQTTACTTASSLIQSKIDFCNSILLNLPATQTNRLQHVLNSAARAATKTPKFHHIIPILKSLHWLKINERIKYEVLSLTYKFLKSGQSSYLRSLLFFPSHRCTRSSFLVTLGRPSLTSRCFYHSTPVLWNNLPSHLRQVVHHVTPSLISNSPVSDLSTYLFLRKLKTHLPFLLSLYSPRLSQDWYLRYWPSFVFSSHTHFAIIHRHIIHANFIVFDL